MSIPESRVEAILSNILGEDYEVKLGKSRVEDLLIGIAGIVANTPQLDSDGLIPISYIPKDAFQDCITVADDTARFALTTDDVQNGDCVYVNSSQIMYFVVDDTKLDLAAGYKALAAGIAAQAVADKDGNDITTTYLKSETYNAGKTVQQGTSVTIDGTTYTVGAGAEIFNSYNSTKAVGNYSHAEGTSTKAVGNYSHAEGASTKASGETSHAEGGTTTASGQSSHAEGSNTTASGLCSHAEGMGTTSSNSFAHAEGGGTTASGACSHAEGGGTTASGESSHAEGGGTTANGQYAHAEGSGTKASSDNQHVEGKYNVEDSSDKFAHIIGNGTADNARSNAFAIDWDGKIYTNNAATGVDVCTDLQSKIDSTHKLSADLVDDTSATHKFATSAQLSQIETNKNDILSIQQTIGNINTVLEEVL